MLQKLFCGVLAQVCISQCFQLSALLQFFRRKSLRIVSRFSQELVLREIALYVNQDNIDVYSWNWMI